MHCFGAYRFFPGKFPSGQKKKNEAFKITIMCVYVFSVSAWECVLICVCMCVCVCVCDYNSLKVYPRFKILGHSSELHKISYERVAISVRCKFYSGQ